MSAMPIGRHRFTVEEYHRMAEAGIFGEDDRVELVDGDILEMNAIGSPHAACVNRLNSLLSGHLPPGSVTIGIQNPVALGPHAEPEPDIAVLRFRADYYAGGHPRPEDVFLLIEVADTSLPFDRSVKLPLYARAGIREVWIVDIDGQAIERHTDPAGGAYRLAARGRRGETLRSEALPALALSVESVLGPPGAEAPG